MTNLLSSPEDLGTTWSAVGGSVSTDQTTAPDGTVSADKIVDPGGGGTSVIAVAQNVTVSVSTVHAFSFFAKEDGLSWAYLELDNFTTPPNNTRCFFDLVNGVVGSAPSANLDDYGIHSIGDGWFRCWGVFTTDGTDTAGTVYIGVSDGDNDVIVARDTTSSIFAWGAVVEQGSRPGKYVSQAGITLPKKKGRKRKKSKRRRPYINYVDIPEDEPEPEPPKRFLRYTPEVKAILERYKK